MPIKSMFPKVYDLPPRRKPKLMQIEGALDLTTITQSGVYILLLEERVVYVGKSRRMLSMIAGHDNLSRQPARPWDAIPGVIFDRILVVPCGPDRAKVLTESLIAEHRPKHNTRAPVVPIRRRA